MADAVVASQGHNPAHAHQSVKQLADWVSRPDWHSILPAYARCVRITRDLPQKFELEPDVFTEVEEQDLYDALLKAEKALLLDEVRTVDSFLTAFLPMIPVVNKFFDKVLVMSEDEKQRRNRLALLQRIVELGSAVADMSKLEGF